MRSQAYTIAITLLALLVLPAASFGLSPRAVAGYSSISNRQSIQSRCPSSKKDLHHPQKQTIKTRPSPATKESILSLRAGASFLPSTGRIGIFFKTYPFVAAFITCGIKAALADFVAQRADTKDNNVSSDATTQPTKKKSSFNFKRNLAFLLYGGAYQGCFQEYIFNTVYPIFFGAGTDPATAIKKVAFNMLVDSPLLCLPAAYLTKAAILRYSFKDAMSRYVNDIKTNGLLTKYWALWTPVMCLTFTIVPEHFRITFVACVSFFWLIILSTISARGDA
jgi:protein Mpv17